MERWKSIEGCPFYEVSSEGNVRVRPRFSKNGRKLQGRYIPIRKNAGGYLVFSVSVGGVAKTLYLHHVMLEVFVGPRPEGLLVCHNNGIRDDCRLDNLRYDTPKGNADDTLRHGTRSMGESHPSTRLSDKNCISALNLLREGWSKRRVARYFGVAHTAIVNLSRGKSRKYLTKE
jgi:hypothetical protein